MWNEGEDSEQADVITNMFDKMDSKKAISEKPEKEFV